ncbi:MoaD/ThiS family protein [Alteriqipengyuania sp. 357]
MTVRVVFLGPLRDLAETEQLDLPAPLCWEGLLGAVPRVVADRLKDSQIHVASGGTLLSDKTTLMAQAGEEVALLPPVSGG